MAHNDQPGTSSDSEPDTEVVSDDLVGKSVMDHIVGDRAPEHERKPDVDADPVTEHLAAPDPVTPAADQPSPTPAQPEPRARGFFDITDETLDTTPEPVKDATPTGKRRWFGKAPTAATAEEVAAAVAARERGPKDLAASVVTTPSSFDLPGGGVGVSTGRTRTGGGVSGGEHGLPGEMVPADGTDPSGGGGGGGGANLSGAWQGGSDPSMETVDPEEEAKKQKKLLALLGVLALLLVGMGAWFFFGGDDEDDIAATPSPTTTVAGATTTAAAAGASTTTAAPGVTPGAAPTAEVNKGLGVEFTPEGALLTGAVATDEVKQQVVGGATLLFQPGLVDGATLTVDPAAPEVNPNEDAIIRSLGEPVMQGVGAIGVTLRRTDTVGVVVVGGAVKSQVAKDRILGSIAGVAGGLDKVIDNLSVNANDSTASTAPVATAPQPTTTAGAAGPGAPSTSVPAAGATTTTTPPAAAPTPSPDAAEVQRALDELLASKVIEFPSGSSSLTAQWVTTVNDVAAALKDNATRIQIAGHTDSRGDPAVNLRLSVDRAESIKAALVERGIAADRLTTTGYGADRPIADNNTDAGRQRNRRIEFVVAAR